MAKVVTTISATREIKQKVPKLVRVLKQPTTPCQRAEVLFVEDVCGLMRISKLKGLKFIKEHLVPINGARRIIGKYVVNPTVLYQILGLSVACPRCGHVPLAPARGRR